MSKSRLNYLKSFPVFRDSSSREFLIISVILFIALLVRLWGINFRYCRPDEGFIYERAVNFLLTGDYNPHWFLYPSFYMYMQAILYAIYYIVSVGVRGMYSLDGIVSLEMFEWGRSLTGILGTGTVYLVYLSAKELFNRRIAYLSALTMALIFNNVYDSHYITIDAPSTFWGMLAFYYACKIFTENKGYHYCLAGIFTGLACATKYNSIVFIIPIIFAHVLHVFRSDNEYILNYKIILVILLTLLGFIIGCPYAVFDPNAFLTGFASSVNMAKTGSGMTGTTNMDGVPTWFWWLKYLFSSGFFYPVFIAAVIGFILVFLEGKKGLFIVSFPISYFLILSMQVVHFDRYADALSPFCAIFVGICFNKLILYLNRYKKNIKISIISLVSFCIFVIPFVRAVIFDYYISPGKDTRDIAADWIEKYIPQSSKILLIGGTESDIRIGSRPDLEIDRANLMDESLSRYTTLGYDYIVINSFLYFQALNYGLWPNNDRYIEIFEKGTLVKEISNPFFKSGFFSPYSLVHGSTVNTYHNPIIWIFSVKGIE